MAAALELQGSSAYRSRAAGRVARLLGNLGTDVAELVAEAGPAARERLMALPGVGPHTADKILEYLRTGEIREHTELVARLPEELRGGPGDDGETTGPVALGSALPLARVLVEGLARHPGVDRIAFGGALRRGCEIVDRIELVAALRDAQPVFAFFSGLEPVAGVLAAEPRRVSVRIERGGLAVRVDLLACPPEGWGEALLRSTGPEAHVAHLEELARDGGTTLEGPEEGAIYRRLGVACPPPETRETRLPTGEPPRLVEARDRRSELHSHTVASDGRLPIGALAACAAARGLEVLAITDHSVSSAQAHGLSRRRLLAHIDAIRAADAEISGIRLLAGAEVDILADGRLDYDDETLARLDIVVASPHSALAQSPAAATRRLVRAASHPRVHILGHPTGRLVVGRKGLEPDLDAVFEAARSHGTALEINSHPRRLDLRDTHVARAVAAGCLLSLNTDAHSEAQLDNLEFGVLAARRGGLEPEGCINCWPVDRLEAWLRQKR